jgi:hypothetical protein
MIVEGSLPAAHAPTYKSLNNHAVSCILLTIVNFIIDLSPKARMGRRESETKASGS